MVYNLYISENFGQVTNISDDLVTLKFINPNLLCKKETLWYNILVDNLNSS